MASILKRASLILLLASTAHGATWFSDGTPASVQANINLASDGDTVVIPAGTFTWNTGIICNKAITIQGQTILSGDHTTWTKASPPTVSDQTVIIDNATGGLLINQSNNTATGTFRLTGITFRGAARITVSPSWMIQMGGTSKKNRGDHLHLDGCNRPWTFGIFCNGVIDHYYSNNLRGNTQEFEVRNRVGANGDEEFAAPAPYGTDQYWYIEDAYVDNNISPVNAAGGSDRNNAGRVSWRYSFLHNVEIVDHGTYSGRRRGGRCGEDYNNTYYWDAGTSTAHVGSMDGITSGSVVYHDNVFIGPDKPQGWSLRDYRTFAGTDTNWGGAGGQNPWDINVTRADGTHVDGEAPFSFYGPATVTASSNNGSSIQTLTVAGNPWVGKDWSYYTAVRSPDTPGVTNYIGQIISNTSNTLTMRWYSEAPSGFPVGSIFRIYKLLGPALDQPGMGQGPLVSPLTPPTPPAVGIGAQQQVEPCYSWNNIYQPDDSHINFVVQPDSQQIIKQNIHYFNDTVKPGYTPFTYPHPLVGSNNTFLSNLYAYYKLDEASGGATDSSGNGKSLSNFGDAIGTATGIVNGARDFDGVSGTTLIRNANTTDFFCGANPFSFSFWVKFDTLPMSNNVGLCNRYEPFGRREYIVYLKQSTSKITFAIDAADGVHSASVAWGTVASPGVWYHVAGGWDGTNIKLSINAGSFITAAYSTVMTNGGDNFKLGYEAQSLDGKMDEFGFWIGRCLTQPEVGQLYNNGAGLPFSSFH